MASIREQIQNILKTRQTATPQELARALRVTPANIRHHIRKLVGDGLVHQIGERQPKGRGRPSQVYALANQGNNLPQLASALLQQTLSGIPKAKASAFLEAVAARMLEPIQGANHSKGHHITQRLVNTISKLEALNYQPRWEAHAEGPQVILEHCPYAQILDEHPELCHMDALLIENILEEPVTQTVKRQTNQLGIRYCLFIVGGTHGG